MYIFVLCMLSILDNKSSFKVNSVPSCLPFNLWMGCGWTGPWWCRSRRRPPLKQFIWNRNHEEDEEGYNSRYQTKPLMRKTKAFGENTAAGSTLWLCAQWCVRWSDKSHTQTTQLMLIIHVDNSCLSGRQIDPWSFSLSVLSVCLCVINHLRH